MSIRPHDPESIKHSIDFLNTLSSRLERFADKMNVLRVAMQLADYLKLLEENEQ